MPLSYAPPGSARVMSISTWLTTAGNEADRLQHIRHVYPPPSTTHHWFSPGIHNLVHEVLHINAAQHKTVGLSS